MTTNLHAKMLAAIDALFSASDAVEEEVAENLLLDVRDEILKQPAQQEPVAWMYDWICDGELIEGWIAHKESEIPRSLARNIRPLHTTPQAQQAPVQGWKLVPLQPTSEMVRAYDEAQYSDDLTVEATNVWVAMLGATPQAQPKENT